VLKAGRLLSVVEAEVWPDTEAEPDSSDARDTPRRLLAKATVTLAVVDPEARSRST
jgi:hypothetical protein